MPVNHIRDPYESPRESQPEAAGIIPAFLHGFGRGDIGHAASPSIDRGRNRIRLTRRAGNPNQTGTTAGGQAGYAPDCKSVKTGSIPVPASKVFRGLACWPVFPYHTPYQVSVLYSFRSAPLEARLPGVHLLPRLACILRNHHRCRMARLCCTIRVTGGPPLCPDRLIPWLQ